MKFSSKKKGFTLIEMLIVIVIIGVLASAMVPRFGSARSKAQDIARRADLQQTATAIIVYQISNGKYPLGVQSFHDTGFQDLLIKGGMVSIPDGGSSDWWRGMDCDLIYGYMYYPMKKNGIQNNGFMLVAKTETEGGSNYVFCDDSSISHQKSESKFYAFDLFKDFFIPSAFAQKLEQKDPIIEPNPITKPVMPPYQPAYCVNVQDYDTGNIDIDQINLCEKVTIGDICDSSACVASSKTQLRYIYKY